MSANLRALAWPAAAAAVLLLLLLALMLPAQDAHSAQPATFGADAATMSPASQTPGIDGGCC